MIENWQLKYVQLAMSMTNPGAPSAPLLDVELDEDTEIALGLDHVAPVPECLCRAALREPARQLVEQRQPGEDPSCPRKCQSPRGSSRCTSVRGGGATGASVAAATRAMVPPGPRRTRTVNRPVLPGVGRWIVRPADRRRAGRRALCGLAGL